jgi:uncharacterized protein (DUF736 family)
MNNTNTNTNKNQNELGALWKKKSRAGMSFLSGYILDLDGQRTDVVVFANNKKTNERAPDYRLYVSKPLETSSNSENKTSDTQPVKELKKVQKTETIEESDDIL